MKVYTVIWIGWVSSSVSFSEAITIITIRLVIADVL